MNSLIFILFCVGFGAMSLSTFGSAYGAFQSSENYIVEAQGFSISEKTIDNSIFDMSFLTTTSGEKLNTKVLDASIFFQGKDFIFSKFDTSILREGKFLRLVGVGEDPQGNELTLRLFGKLMGTSSDATIYEFKGKLDHNNEIYNSHFVGKTQTKTKISQVLSEIPDSEEKPSIEMETSSESFEGKDPDEYEITIPKETQTSDVKFKLLGSASERVRVGKWFNFLIKAYDETTNPTNNLQFKGGGVPGVEISAQLFDRHDNLVTTFDAVTNEFGAYEDKYYFSELKYNQRIGAYTFYVNATYGTQQENVSFTFNLLERK